MARPKPPISMYPIRKRLPQSYSIEIGRITTRWALLEWYLKQLVYLLLEINTKAGRVAVRSPRVADFVPMIKDLVTIRNVKLRVNWKRLQRNLDDLAHYRNCLAHGIWIKHPDTKDPVLQVTTRDYEYAPGNRAKAKIDPGAFVVSIAFLRRLSKEIEITTNSIRKIGELTAEQLAASPGKPRPPQLPSRGPLHSQIDKSRPSPPQSFRA